MDRETRRLLKEVYCPSDGVDHGIWLVYIPDIEPEKGGRPRINWKDLAPRISGPRTTVLEFEHKGFHSGSFAESLENSGNLLYELFTVHTKNLVPYPPVLFLCVGSGGLLMKEAIASAGEHLGAWPRVARCILCIVFLGTPHMGEMEDAYGANLVQSLRLNNQPPINLNQATPKAKIISGYETPVPRKRFSVLRPAHTRAKLMVVGKDQACIGIKGEILEPMNMCARQILDPAQDSSFRNTVARTVAESVDCYYKLVRDPGTSSTPGSTPNSTPTESLTSPVHTPSTGSVSSSSRQKQRKINLPFIFPRNFLNLKPTTFQPRPEASSRMDDALLPSRADPDLRPNLLVFIITGLGGMGKTELARDFAIRNKTEFGVIIFLVADQRERLSKQYSDVASQIGVVGGDSAPDPENDRERLKLWMENPVRAPGELGESPTRTSEDDVNWLLILDSADNPQILNDFWPSTGFGSVLVTSRDPSIRFDYYPLSDGLTLDGLPIEDSMTLLKRLTRNQRHNKEVDHAAQTIVQRLEGIPLAIDQIGSIITRRCLSLNEFVRDYTKPSHYHKLYDDRRVKRGYEHNLGSVWAFESLESEAVAAVPLLRVLSMLDPTCIQEEVILQSLQIGTIDCYPRTKSDYDDVLARLIERSIVHKDRDTGSLHLHRLVQDVARARMIKKIDELKVSLELASRSVAACFPFRDEEMNTAGSIKRWQRCSAMYTHIVQLSQVAQELLETRRGLILPLEFVDLLYEAAWWQCERGEVNEALPLVDLCSTICDSHPNETQGGPKRRTPVQFRQTKIWACKIAISMATGDYTTAFHYSQIRCKVSDDEYKATGLLTPFQTSTNNDLGEAYAMNRQYDKALRYLEKSAELRKQMPKFQNDWLFSPYYHMSITFHCMKKYSEAADLLHIAIKDREAALGLNDRVSGRTGALFYVLGNVRNEQDHTDEAYSLHHRALMQSRQTTGESSLATLRCSQKVAEHYERYGHGFEARPLLQKILDICGERSDRKQEVAQAAFLLSKIQKQHGDFSESRRNIEKAVKVHNTLRPLIHRTVDSLTSYDVKNLVHYDYV